MHREKLTYGSKQEWLDLRKRDITSSEVSALFDMNPYMSYQELWYSKARDIEDDLRDSERMRHGIRLERAIAETVITEHDPDCDIDALVSLDDYIRIPSLRIGSSFDFKLGDELVEVKNVDSFIYKKDWICGEAPMHIELQVQHQMLVSGLSDARICALVGGNRSIMIYRRANKDIQGEILRRAADFWLSVSEGTAPKLDELHDSKIIQRIAGEKAKEGRTIQPTPEMVNLSQQYTIVTDKVQELRDMQTRLKSKILLLSCGAKYIENDEVRIITKPFRVKWRSK